MIIISFFFPTRAKVQKSICGGGIIIDFAHMGRWFSPHFQRFLHPSTHRHIEHTLTAINTLVKKNSSLPTVEMHGRTNLGSTTILSLLLLFTLRLELGGTDFECLLPLCCAKQTQTHAHINRTLTSISTSVVILYFFLLLCLFHIIHS